MSKHYPLEFKYHIVKQVLALHKGVREVAQEFQVASHSSVVVWLQRFEKYGMNGLKRQSFKPRKANMPKSKKTSQAENPQDIKALLKRIEYLEAENAILKKLRELREQEAKQQKEKRQKR